MRWSFALLLLSCVPGCSGAGEREESGTPTSGPAEPAARIAAVFGPAVSLAMDRSPNVFHGDFNGDGLADLLALAAVRPGNSRLPEGVRVLQPWSAAGKPYAADDLSAGARVSVAIIHGDSAEELGAGFLLHDPDPISILDTAAAREAFVAGRAEALAMDAEIAGRALGDVFVLPTEAGIDTYLFWDGGSYRAYQPLESP